VDIDSMKLRKYQKWDEKWRIIIFDVPNRKSKNRHAFTEKLKELGFVMIQKSVWAYPFECYKEVAILRKFYEIERYLSYFEAVEIEDEAEWRRRFNLKNKRI
jgi:phenylacetic acid degradation operon negative regulatory protein